MDNIGTAILIIGSAWLACQYPGFVIPAIFLVLVGLDWGNDQNSYFCAKAKYYIAKRKLMEENKKEADD